MAPKDAGSDVLKFHDPLILKEGDRYYCFSTDTNAEGVQVCVSGDLADWKLHRPALAQIPPEVVRHTGKIPSGPRAGKVNFWAPEVIKDEGEYRLYFCSSQFGTSQSMIGLAASAAVDGPYQYLGCVLKTYHTGRFDSPNAIDPCVARDRDGLPWMVYGSFFGGIYIAPLDKDGFMVKGGYGKCIAGGNHTPVEGAYILYDREGDRFCLFLSYGSLLRDYNIRVSYSQNIEGPYFDSAGQEMTNLDPVLSAGDKIAGGYNFDIPGADGFMAPGHNSLLFLDGPYMVHHIRREGVLSPSYLHIRKVFFSKKRQVFVSPVPLGVAGAGAIPQKGDLTGMASVIRLDPFNNGVTYGRKINFCDLGLHPEDGGNCSLRLYNTCYEGRVFACGGTVYFTAISESGECVWGRSC